MSAASVPSRPPVPFTRAARPATAPARRYLKLQLHESADRQHTCELRVSASASASASGTGDFEERPGGVGQLLDAAWRFTRPHTIRGTLLGTTALVTKALIENSHLIDWGLLPRALMGLLALLCGNGYIVGINQVYDVDIDTVNKPFLPIASGALSPAAGWALCIIFAITGLALTALNYDRLITSLYAFGLFLGTIYSVPPLRLKRFAVPAFLIIATVRGVLLNFGVYHATRAAIGLSFEWSPAIAFITGFVTLFAVAIAITKDLPDVEGDRKYGIETFATRMGVRNIAFLGTGILLLNYVTAITLAIVSGSCFNVPVMAGAHAVLGVLLVWQTVVLDRLKYSQQAIRDYYRSIWNLFYCEYLILPFI